MAVVLFDVLPLAGQDVMREPWRDRRKRLEKCQAVRVPRNDFELRLGARAELVCWASMPSGMLRHPFWLR